MALGGFLAIADRRYRLARRTSDAPAGALATGTSARTESGAAEGMKALKFIIPLAIFVVLCVFLAIGLTKDPRKVPSPFIGKPAPAFTLAKLHEPEAKFSPEEMKGKVWLLNVWASWCVSCRVEHPVLNDMSRKGIVPIVGLNYKDARADATKWLQQHGDPYQLLRLGLRRQGRHRLRRLRRARDLRDRQAGRHPLQADRPDHARGRCEKTLLPLLAQAQRMKTPRSSPSLLAAAARRLGTVRRDRQPRPEGGSAAQGDRARAALPRLPEPDHRRFRRAARAWTCASRPAP